MAGEGGGAEEAVVQGGDGCGVEAVREGEEGEEVWDRERGEDGEEDLGWSEIVGGRWWDGIPRWVGSRGLEGPTW